MAITAALLLRGTASAQPAAPAPPGDSSAAEARRLLEQGADAYQKGDYPGAEAAFEQSFKLKPTYDTASNLGSAEAKQGKHREAAEHFAFALRNLPTSESPDTQEKLAKLLAESKAKVVTLQLEVNAVGAEVILNGNAVGKSPIEGDVFADAGTLLVVANAPKYERFEKTENFAAGSSQTIKIELKRVPGTEEPEGRPSWPGWLMGGVGLAAAGVGGALIGVGQAKLSDAEELGATISAGGGSCVSGDTQTSADCSDGRAMLDDAGVMTGAGIGLLVTGGALLIGGIIYLALPSDGGSSETQAFVTPLVTPDFQGIVVLGTF
jgi:hypothetical protein